MSCHVMLPFLKTVMSYVLTANIPHFHLTLLSIVVLIRNDFLHFLYTFSNDSHSQWIFFISSFSVQYMNVWRFLDKIRHLLFKNKKKKSKKKSKFALFFSSFRILSSIFLKDFHITDTVILWFFYLSILPKFTKKKFSSVSQLSSYHYCKSLFYGFPYFISFIFRLNLVFVVE